MLRREQAAEYCGIGATKFDELVGRGVFPSPVRLDGCVRWDRYRLDRALDRMDDETTAANPWDSVA